MPKQLKSLTHNDILRYEEILRICKIAKKTGIHNFKVTGGEPLLRKGCVNFLRELKSAIKNVTITTNGVLLENFIHELVEMKIDGVNISLDSINSETYKKITGKDDFQNVWRSLEKAVQSGLRTKINFVPMRGINDNEIIPMARLAKKIPIDIRFIEVMPTQAVEPRIASVEIFEKIKKFFPDLTEETQRGNGPARYYKNEKMQGRIGIINAVENCFCSECNRVRLTCEGFLKLCLFHDDGLDLRAMLRGGANDFEIETAFRNTVLKKPKRHFFENPTHGIKNMSRIGG